MFRSKIKNVSNSRCNIFSCNWHWSQINSNSLNFLYVSFTAEPDEFPPEEDFPEEFMPPPIRDDFHISRDEFPQNNYIQDKGTCFAFSLNVRMQRALCARKWTQCCGVLLPLFRRIPTFIWLVRWGFSAEFIFIAFITFMRCDCDSVIINGIYSHAWILHALIRIDGLKMWWGNKIFFVLCRSQLFICTSLFHFDVRCSKWMYFTVDFAYFFFF